MLQRLLFLSLALSAYCLRVQQRGADVKITKNGTLELKEKEEAGSTRGAIRDEARNWVKGTGPSYKMTLKDVLLIAQWEGLHPFRCFKGWDSTDTPNLVFGASNQLDPVMTAYKDNNPEKVCNANDLTDLTCRVVNQDLSWRMNCLINNPIKWKAIADPFALHAHSTGNAYASGAAQYVAQYARWWFGDWRGNDGMFRGGAAAQIKKYLCANSDPESCAGAPDYTFIYYVSRVVHSNGVGNLAVNPDIPEMVSGSSMIMSAANAGDSTSGGGYSDHAWTGSICYVQEEYDSLEVIITSMLYLKCSCTIDGWTGADGGCKQYTTYGNCAQGTSGTSPDTLLPHHVKGQKHCSGGCTGSGGYKVQKNFVSHACAGVTESNVR